MAQSQQDMQEQLIILRGEVSEQSALVNKLIDESKEIRAFNDEMIRKAQMELQRLQKEALAIAGRSKEIITDCEEREQAVEKAEEELKSKVAGVNNLFDTTKNHIASIVESSKEEVAAFLRIIQERTDERNGLDNGIELRKKELEALDKAVSLAKETNIEMLDSIEDKKDALDSIISQINEMTFYFKILKEETQKESVKIKEANEAIALREEELTKREKNFQIMKGRLAKVFNIIYPEQNLDNLI